MNFISRHPNDYGSLFFTWLFDSYKILFSVQLNLFLLFITFLLVLLVFLITVLWQMHCTLLCITVTVSISVKIQWKVNKYIWWYDMERGIAGSRKRLLYTSGMDKCSKWSFFSSGYYPTMVKVPVPNEGPHHEAWGTGGNFHTFLILALKER